MVDAPIGFHTDSWLIRIPGGPAFATNAVVALKASAASRIPGPTQDIFYALAAAFEEAERTRP
jgi:hypothetical protein